MRLVVFGLSISSSWGNGHATLWRGLVAALTRLGCRVTFFERDVPYYAANRDLGQIAGGQLVLYPAWSDVAALARREIDEADAVIVTSYCPDALAASAMLNEAHRPLRVFYDLDTPVTLALLAAGHRVGYIPEHGLGDFDLVLSYTGGEALRLLRTHLRARNVAPLYGHADPSIYRPTPPLEHYRAALSYLGTYAADRQPRLDELLVAPARRRPDLRFVIGGAQYPDTFPWQRNIHFVRHLPPDEHPAFYASSRLTLNVTRAAMADLGWCPSGRLFEAAACGCPVISDEWRGLDDFFAPGAEILLARSRDDVLAALEAGEDDLCRIGAAARERVAAGHTSAHRAETLLQLVTRARPTPKELEGQNA